MPKLSSKYVCQQCGYESPRWYGKCPECGNWNSMAETVVQKSLSLGKNGKHGGLVVESREPVALSDIPISTIARNSSGLSELDRVLGGGLVTGQVILLAGEPGIGKSTILLQVAQSLAKSGVIYVSGEESSYQIKLRAERLGIKGNITLVEETNIDALIDTVEKIISSKEKPGLLVLDSIQTMMTGDLSGLSGSVGQVRECTYRIVRLAKTYGIPVFIVGHVTKEGTVAGPAVLMHIVDTVLWFEGDKSYTTRMLRAVKNRFGPTDEVGIFKMEEKGLISVDNPQELFVETVSGAAAGKVIAVIMQGTRPVLVEIQALVVPTKMAFPKRVAQGIDAKKFELILAVLTRRCGLKLNDVDCYANVVGGVNLSKDPSADLAIALAIASAYYDKALPLKAVALGEVGLLGDIRGVIAQEKRIKEAKRLGMIKIISNNLESSLVSILKSIFK